MRRRRKDPRTTLETPELAALADGSLDPDRRDALEAEVAASPELAGQLAEQQRAVMLVQNAGAEIEAPTALRARIDAQQRPRRAPMRGRLAFLAASAAVVVAASVAVVVTVSQGSSVVELHAALAATELAPGAAGEASLYKRPSGWQIDFDASGLPRRDGGDYYQAWLRNPAGVLVPIGTFNQGRKVTLWAGVSPKDYTMLTVTRESADNDQVSSGEKVLAGNVERG